MNSTDNDYMPIDETEEYNLIEEQDEEEDSVNPEAERFVGNILVQLLVQ